MEMGHVMRMNESCHLSWCGPRACTADLQLPLWQRHTHPLASLRVCVCVCVCVYVCVSMCVYVKGLFCNIIGHFCNMIGLFCNMIGLICNIIGVLCNTIGLFCHYGSVTRNPLSRYVCVWVYVCVYVCVCERALLRRNSFACTINVCVRARARARMCARSVTCIRASLCVYDTTNSCVCEVTHVCVSSLIPAAATMVAYASPCLAMCV